MGIDAYNLGQILKAKGDLEGAERLVKRAMRIGERVYGPYHAKLAIRADNLGQIMWAKGDLAAARYYLELALQINEKVYGPNHAKSRAQRKVLDELK